MPLTHLAIRNARPQDRPFKLSDAKGLFLLVSPSGSRLWRLKYRYEGREKLLALGAYPEVGLAQARARRDDARASLAQGLDPSATRKAAKRAAKIAAANSFEAVARDYTRKQANRWTPEHGRRFVRRLENDLFPALGHRPVAAIEPPDLLAVLRRVEARGATDLSHRLLQEASAVFRYAIACGLARRDPAADLRGALQPHVKSHRLAVKPDELPELLRRIDAYDSEEYGGDLQTRLALQFLFLTAVRTKELRGAEWREIDRGKALWIIPADRMKMRSEHVVPLSRHALAILDELHALTGRDRLVFRGEGRKGVLSENTILFALYRLGYRSRMTGHGVRLLFSTIANESGLFSADAIERQLAHRERNAVRAAYDRGQRLDERRGLVQWWADHLDALRAPA